MKTEKYDTLRGTKGKKLVYSKQQYTKLSVVGESVNTGSISVRIWAKRLWKGVLVGESNEKRWKEIKVEQKEARNRRKIERESENVRKKWLYRKLKTDKELHKWVEIQC